MDLVSTVAQRLGGAAGIIDVVSGAALVVAGVAANGAGRGPVAICAAAVAGGTVALRRRWPRLACVLVLVALGLYEWDTGGEPFDLGAVAAALDYYAVGRRSAIHGVEPATVGLLLAPVALVAANPAATSAADVIAPLAFLGYIPFAAGHMVAARERVVRALRRTTAALDEAAHDGAMHAAAVERARVARELHDIVAHGVSVMVIQAVAARSVARRDSDRAREALRAVENSGREALDEMRRLVGVLRRDEAAAGVATAGMAQLPLLVARARSSGLAVDLRVVGSPRPLADGVDLAAYRIVQEALTNTLKHAGAAHADVTVRYTRRALEISAHDDGGGPSSTAIADGGGHGLLGMQERVLMYGGDLRWGRRRGGGFGVHARLPVTERRTS